MLVLVPLHLQSLICNLFGASLFGKESYLSEFFGGSGMLYLVVVLNCCVAWLDGFFLIHSSGLAE